MSDLFDAVSCGRTTRIPAVVSQVVIIHDGLQHLVENGVGIVRQSPDGDVQKGWRRIRWTSLLPIEHERIHHAATIPILVDQRVVVLENPAHINDADIFV